MPFVTEELWDRFGYGPPCSLIRAPWPEPFAVPGAAEARAELDWVVRLIGEVRTVRAEMNVPPSRKAPVLLKDASPATLARGERWFEAIARLARAESIAPLAGEVPHGSAQAVVDETTVVIPLAGLIDLAAERARLQKERDPGGGRGARKSKRSSPTRTSWPAPRKRWSRKTANAWQPPRRNSPASTPPSRGSPREARAWPYRWRFLRAA